MKHRFNKDKMQKKLDYGDVDVYLEEIAQDVLHDPQRIEGRAEFEEQFSLTGSSNGRIYTLICEYRYNEIDDQEYVWIVTFWKATKKEVRRYAIY